MWKGLRCEAGRRVRKSASRCGGTGLCYSEKSMWDVATFVFACFSSGCFIVTKMALDESGDLDKVDVRVEKVNEAQHYRRVLAVTRRDETRCPVIKPLNNSVLGRYRSSCGVIRGGRRTDKSGRRKKGELKRTWVASFK